MQRFEWREPFGKNPPENRKEGGTFFGSGKSDRYTNMPLAFTKIHPAYWLLAPRLPNPRTAFYRAF